MRTLFLDMETTGKAFFKLPSYHPSQPRMVSLGAILADENSREIAILDLIIKPDGFEIPEGASAIHGITTEHAEKVGVPIKVALSLLGDMAILADQFAAHNIQFDRLITERESGYVFLDGKKPLVCTMEAMTPICNLPGPYGPKWPKLEEAYFHCFNRKLEGAHGALADCRACKEIYGWLTERNHRE